MARQVRSVKLNSRNAREKLKPRHNPYWIRIERNAHLGYRKGALSGSWIARVRIANGYKMKRIAVSDDTTDANGVEVLDFFQAQDKAREWFDHIHKVDKGIGIENYHVNDALDDYLDYLNAHGKSADRVKYGVDSYMRPVFGHLNVNELTSKKIADWHKGLVEKKPRLRSKKGQIAHREKVIQSQEYLRKRKCTANRILTSLKAALNRAYYEGKIASDDAWRRVKPFRNVESVRIRFLTLEECSRLVSVCDPCFKKMIQAGLLTGCRYGELTNLAVKDFQQSSGTLFIATTKSGKPRYITLEEQGIRFFKEEVKNKTGDELIFTREDGEKWGRSHQTRRLKDACEEADIVPAISFHILRHTHASHLVQRGVPLPVIAAQLGHSDTRTCEKHYAHLSASYIADTIRTHFPKMDIMD